MTLKTSVVVRALGVAAFVLVVLGVLGQAFRYLLGLSSVFGLVSLFNLDGEQNIPALFSVFLLFFAAVLLGAIAVSNRKRGGPDGARWTFLAVALLLMAVDEGVSLHERLIDPITAALGGGSLGVFHFAWVIPGIAVVLVVLAFLLGFLRRLPKRTMLTFILAGVIYFAGAIGLELVGGKYSELHPQGDFTYALITAVEESLEMAGSIVLIFGLLEYLAAFHGEVLVSFERTNADASGAKAPDRGDRSPV